MAKRTRERGFPADPEPLPVPVVDNHTHLDHIGAVLPDTAPDGEPGDAWPPSVTDHLARAARAGVDRVVQVGCDLPSARWTDALLTSSGAGAQWVAGVVGAVAIHPNEATLHAGVLEVGPDGLAPEPEAHHAVGLGAAIAEIADLAQGNERIRAIGETGMDLFRTGSRGEQAQRESFRAHIALAKELGLALQIHDRDAHAQVVEVLLADGAPERTVFHCFSGDAEMARVCAENGWYLSFAGPVTFKANHHLREALTAAPRELILLETDAPYLTPHPYRGQPNAPFAAAHTARAMAAHLEEDLRTLCTDLAANSERVYGAWW
ncbi:TatD family hydrolase [Promicromonospora iranensis]|uniref:TatD DNase family protein n=1 Tax=Promicromonospora iranensis TaxID=1105144 RepID=A0ABU2CRG6_9MICO|nr:TatD family hydrolase [Promicromonospora iranensis]MDR7383930.1 TatD DNase family protein [Promicromonospora iranensis]